MYTTKCIIQFIGLIRRITINKAKQINFSQRLADFSSTVIFQIIWSRLIFDSASFINTARERREVPKSYPSQQFPWKEKLLLPIPLDSSKRGWFQQVSDVKSIINFKNNFNNLGRKYQNTKWPDQQLFSTPIRKGSEDQVDCAVVFQRRKRL